jgi:hypothetical protein
VRRFLTYVVVVAKVGSPDHPSVHILGDVLGGEGRDLARKTRPKNGSAAAMRRGEEMRMDGWWQCGERRRREMGGSIGTAT